jgi:polyribonucleotide nucleotidyltransferase
MASICGATLALLDAGVPITAPVAGVSVGLAKGKDEDESNRLLLDITGNEDYFGSMDFKIAGTDSKVTAFQLDVKSPLPLSIISKALHLGKDARGEILREMESQSKLSSSGVISDLLPRSDLKDSAPRVNIVRYDPTRKKSLVGPGGAVIRQMEDRFNVSMDLTQEGQCLLFGEDHEMVRQAKAAVMDLVADVEVGGVYEGTVMELRDFGAIIEILRNKEGLCHISELANKDELKSNTRGTMGLVHSLLEVGQKIKVVCSAVDPVQGTIRLKPHRKLSLSRK